MKNLKHQNITTKTFLVVFIVFFTIFNIYIDKSYAYPIYAQQAYTNPRASNGKIACANCHLAEKPIEIKTPQAILPDTIFETIVKVPYDKTLKQIQGNGKYIKDISPKPGYTVKEGKKIILYTGDKGNYNKGQVVMPNVVGYDYREASQILRGLGLGVQFINNGGSSVSSQSVGAGQSLYKGNTIILGLEVTGD